jgi:ribose 1,5-bisphosphate isomerase
MDDICKIEENIKSLAIQGATNVAQAVLDGVIIASSVIPDDINPFQFLKSSAEKLAYARPTESLAQNAIRFIFSKNDGDCAYYLEKTEEYKELIKRAKQKMANFSTELIKDGGVYLTHCHSSTVISGFMNAKKQNRKFSVIATETRPLFQGRKTVKELLDAGIDDVTLIIDDAVTSVLSGKIRPIDAVFIGADLLSDAGFVNKVGSLGISYAAQKNNIPLYSTCILLKYDPRIFSENLIEKRSGTEIWEDAPLNLKFYAPAFDFIPYESHVKVICEEGMIEGFEIKEKVESSYSFISNQ